MVDPHVQADVELVVRSRLTRTNREIHHSLKQIADGNPLASEPQHLRRVARIQTKSGSTREQAEMMSAAIDMTARRGDTRAKLPGPEAIWGSTLDFVGVAFLDRGRRAADAVGRVAFLNDQPQGSGFLVAPNLFLTNHHVIGSEADSAQFQVQFDYEYNLLNRAKEPSSFFFDPDFCFITDDIDGLDFTLIGLGDQRSGARELKSFGFIPLSDASDKHALGEIANVVQHPAGRFKEIVLRENHLVARDETDQVLHYVADTEQGSSGSPVFNNEWEPIALHHWGGPWREIMGTDGQPLSTEINEGIRVSAIVRHLRQLRPAGRNAVAVRDALALWDALPRRPMDIDDPRGEEYAAVRAPKAAAAPPPAARQNADGSISITVPVEINVRAGLAVPPGAVAVPDARKPAPLAEAGTWKTEDFDDRDGYEPGFITGHNIALPNHDDVDWRVAENQLAGDDDDPHELRYHHFSIVMNAERRLAYFTAVNINGRTIKAVDRETKTVIDKPTLKDLGIESLGAEGAEASDDFRPDRRIKPEEQMNRPFYEKQIVAGFLDTKSPERTARIFQKGHIILRGDPAWGTEDQARAAERDTFFYTNAAPQVGFFNQGSDLNRPGSKGKLRWRAVETYVLRNAVTMKKRVTVFAGPVFDDDNDPRYRFDAKVPMRFWKIAVWNDGTALRSVALLADQRPVLKIMPEAIAAEAFGDEEELARVTEFLSTVAEIEALTKLKFTNEVRAGDIRAGMASGTTSSLTLRPEDLAQSGRRTMTPRRKAAKRKR